MSNDETNPNREIIGRLCQSPWCFAESPYNYLSFVIPLFIPHSDFVILLICGIIRHKRKSYVREHRIHIEPRL